jgi:hypothetical protein
VSLVESRNCFAQSSGATHCLDDALELDKNLVACPPDEMPTELKDLRLDDFRSQQGQSGEAACLISGQKLTVPGEQDCRKSALNAPCRIL